MRARHSGALVFLAGVVLLSVAGKSWTQTWQALPGAPTAGRHEDVYFVDSLHGWVVNLQGEVHRTADGGATWRTSMVANALLRSVVFIDSLRGWAGTLSGDNPLYATTDGGVSWWSVPGIPDPRPLGICGLAVVGDSVIVGTGRFNGPPRFIRSVDAGRSWTSVDLSAVATTLVDCHFVSPDSGFVVGGLGSFPNQTRALVLWTGDGGESWERRHLGNWLAQWCWKISFPTRRVGYVSLESLDN